MLVKRIFIIAFIVFGIIFCQGCGNNIESISAQQYDKYEVLEIYNQIADNIEKFSGVKVKMDTAFFINNGVDSLQLNMVTNIQQSIADSGIEMEMKSSTEFLDSSVQAISYYKDGCFYTDYSNEKVRYNIKESDIRDDSNIFLVKISEDQVKNIFVESEDDGIIDVTLVAEPEAVMDTLNKYIVQIMHKDISDMNISKFTITVKADDNNIIKSCDTLISMSCNEENNNMEYTIDSHIEYFDVNEPVNIIFPDFTEYKEIDV